MNKNRRSFIFALGAGAVSIPLSFTYHGVVSAAEMPKLDPEESTAKSLAYSHQSPNPSKSCAGCQFYSGTAGSEWGSCVIFPDKLVSATGVCNSWFEKA